MRRNTSARTSRAKHAAILIILMMILTACAGGAGDSGDSLGTAAGTGAATGSDETLVVAIGSEPEQLDPQQYRGGVDLYMITNVYERLIERDVNGEQAPALATDWETSEDGLTTTFYLREGVTFHNGEDFTAHDVKFSFERAVSDEIENPFAEMSGGWESIEVVDDHTVVFHFAEPNGDFIPVGGFAFIVPQDYVTENGNDILKEAPVGTGPLQFVDRTIGEGFTLERFEDYHGDPAGHHTFEFQLMGDAMSRVSALRAGQVDVIDTVPPHQVATLENEPDITVEEVVLGDNVYLMFSDTAGDQAWSDPRVRRALAHAVDQEAILENVLLGLGRLMPGPSPLNPNFDALGIEQYPYDVARAGELLAEAGYEDGFSMEIVTPVNGRLPNTEEYAQAIAGYWSEVGVEVDVRTLPYSEWIDAGVQETFEGAYVMIFGDTLAFDPEFRMNYTFPCEAPYSTICNDELEPIVEELSVTADPDARREVIGEIWSIVRDQAYYIYGYTTVGAWAMTDGVQWTPFFGVPYSKIYNATPAA